MEKNESKAAGGIARAKALTAERRQSIAVEAAAARWGYEATHKGSFKEHFGIDVDCYVLDDKAKTAAISQRGLGAALNLGEGGSRLPRMLTSKTMSQFAGPELMEKMAKPLMFQWGPPGTSLHAVRGHDVTVLIDICNAIRDADRAGALQDRQKKMVRQADIIVSACAKNGIKGLVYALAGYDATREEIVAAFKGYVREEAREYEKEFPDQLYSEWYRLYDLPRPEKNKPWKFMHLTLQQVYQPLARSNGKVLQLTQAQRADSKKGGKKLHQFLSDIGVKTLRMHLGQLLGIAQISDNKVDYEKHVNKVFGKQTELNFG